MNEPTKPLASALRSKLNDLFELGREYGMKENAFSDYDTSEIEQKRDRIIAELVAEFGKE